MGTKDIRALYMRYSILEDERNDLRSSNTALIGDVARLTAENIQLREQVARFTAELNEAHDEINGLEQEH